LFTNIFIFIFLKQKIVLKTVDKPARYDKITIILFENKNKNLRNYIY